MTRGLLKYLLGLSAVIVFLAAAWTQSGETGWNEMENRLPRPADQEEFSLLVKLAAKYCGIDAEKVLSYGRKALELLEKDRQIRQLQLRLQKQLKNSFIIISLLIIILVVMIFNRCRLRGRVNRKLTEEIAKHKKTAGKLQESEEKFRTMAEKSVVGIYIIQDNVFKYFNPRFLEIFGYNAEEITGRGALKMVLEEDRPMVAERIRQRMEGKIDTANYQFRGLDKQGDILFLESFGSRFLYRGKPAVIGTLIDFTERKKAEEELHRNQKLEAVGILAGGIAHDFNNLLTIIINYHSLLKESINPLEDEKILEIFAALENTSRQATEIGSKLLNLTSGKWIMTGKLSFRDILKRTADRHPDVKPLMSDVSIAPGLKPLNGNERQLGEVMFNLLENAGEASAGHGHVSIKSENITVNGSSADIYGIEKGDYVKVSIIDNGRGIPPDRLEDIFTPYFSTKETYTRKGLGLGLPTCYSIIKRHGGYISLRSREGKGTTAEFYVPVFPDPHPGKMAK